jgi:hypothetical protein
MSSWRLLVGSAVLSVMVSGGASVDAQAPPPAQLRAAVTLNAAGQIASCYNSQVSGADASTAPCRFSVTVNGSGDRTIEFGFPVRQRFFQVTPVDPNTAVKTGGVNAGLSFAGATQSQVRVLTKFFDGATWSHANVGVYVLVF